MGGGGEIYRRLIFFFFFFYLSLALSLCIARLQGNAAFRMRLPRPLKFKEPELAKEEKEKKEGDGEIRSCRGGRAGAGGRLGDRVNSCELRTHTEPSDKTAWRSKQHEDVEGRCRLDGLSVLANILFLLKQCLIKLEMLPGQRLTH